MRLQFLWRLLCGVAIAVLAAPGSSPAAGKGPRVDAFVFTDRSRPDVFVFVTDLRINDTLLNEDGDRFFVLTSAEGTFQLPFDAVAEVVFTQYLGLVRADTPRYEVRVVLPSQQGERRGTIELRVLRGLVQDLPWHDLLVTRADHGASLYRIFFRAPEP